MVATGFDTKNLVTLAMESTEQRTIISSFLYNEVNEVESALLMN
jgi:hypothetical protein